MDEYYGKGSFTEMKNKWSPEKGYDEFEKNESKYPRPGVGPGNELGLTLILKANIDDYFCSSTDSYGFKVLVHSAGDLARYFSNQTLEKLQF